MNHPSTTYTDNKGVQVTLTWIRDNDLSEYQPCTQAYGIVFNDQNEILLIQVGGKWQIPGGTPEPGETPEQTLRRELLEEADVTVRDVRPLGAQRVDYSNNPNVEEGDVFYQYRYVCRLDELHESTPDPVTGETYPRKFVPAETVTDYVNWGELGKAMFEDAAKAIVETTNS